MYTANTMAMVTDFLGLSPRAASGVPATHEGKPKAAVEFAFQQMGVHRLRVAAATDNHRSLAVIWRLGFRFEGVSRQAEFCSRRWLDHAVFGLLSTDREEDR